MVNFNWKRPLQNQVSEYKWGYIKLVPESNLVNTLIENRERYYEFFSSLDSNMLSYVYAPGKWTIREILLHIIDTERIFTYRILCFLRGELQSLPGYDDVVYNQNSFANTRTIKSLMDEYVSVRNATISLLNNIDESCINNVGTANGSKSTVLELAYMIAGHEIHHLNVIKERYLKQV